MEIERINSNNKIKSIERIKKIEKIVVVEKDANTTKEDENGQRQKRKNAKEIFEMENSRKQHIRGLENSEKQKVANFKNQYKKRNDAYEKIIEDTIEMYQEKEQEER